MAPLLFALVDAVLRYDVEEARAGVSRAAFHPLPHFTLALGQEADAIEALGWWRSTWGER